eukprot:Tamp_31685.p2 GENE.Tamp_31685~~Tamp_31685.p2  ORF type:complete len:103 (+),score=8.09 Tamp_31685:107-415(+)
MSPRLFYAQKTSRQQLQDLVLRPPPALAERHRQDISLRLARYSKITYEDSDGEPIVRIATNYVEVQLSLCCVCPRTNTALFTAPAHLGKSGQGRIKPTFATR